ncbi:MAG: hypothetical protein AAF170_12115 [Bacteroidota bacterium]
MTRVLFLLLALPACLTAPFHAGVQEGRRGNAVEIQGDFEGAEAAYLSGLAQEEVPPDVQARLWHNVALMRARTDRLADADSAFIQALELTASPATRARIAYDAGTAQLQGDNARRAVAYLRRALLLQPDYADARRNIEIALRRIQPPPEQPETPEPSDFARRLKEQADALIDQQQYRDALDLMEDGRARDSTVAAFDEFIGRLSGVVQIEESVAPAPSPPTSVDSSP